MTTTPGHPDDWADVEFSTDPAEVIRTLRSAREALRGQQPVPPEDDSARKS